MCQLGNQDESSSTSSSAPKMTETLLQFRPLCQTALTHSTCAVVREPLMP
jgi:hypothetical protein